MTPQVLPFRQSEPHPRAVLLPPKDDGPFYTVKFFDAGGTCWLIARELFYRDAMIAMAWGLRK